MELRKLKQPLRGDGLRPRVCRYLCAREKSQRTVSNGLGFTPESVSAAGLRRYRSGSVRQRPTGQYRQPWKDGVSTTA